LVSSLLLDKKKKRKRPSCRSGERRRTKPPLHICKLGEQKKAGHPRLNTSENREERATNGGCTIYISCGQRKRWSRRGNRALSPSLKRGGPGLDDSQRRKKKEKRSRTSKEEKRKKILEEKQSLSANKEREKREGEAAHEARLEDQNRHLHSPAK